MDVSQMCFSDSATEVDFVLVFLFPQTREACSPSQLKNSSVPSPINNLQSFSLQTSSTAISDACSASKEPLRSLVTYHKKTTKQQNNLGATAAFKVRITPSLTRWHCQFTIHLSTAKDTLPWEEEVQDKNSSWFTRYESMSPTFEGDVTWIGPNCLCLNFQVRWLHR